MVRYLFVSILLLFISKVSFAQKDTLVYFLKNSGKQVSTKDSADMIVFILPPDTTIDKHLSIVKGFYPNGKIRMIAGSLTHSLPLNLQGNYIDFFPNGHKMRIRNFVNGHQLGDVIAYYPNGRFYYKKTFSEEITEKPDILLEDCSDSTGKVLTENGNGHWTEYNQDFSTVSAEGKVTNGRTDSTWNFVTASGHKAVRRYKDGNPLSLVSVNQAAGFPGGADNLMHFLAMHTIYPKQARDQGIEGTVIVSFVVEIDGSLTNVHVTQGIGGGCDEEAVRVVKLSPKWRPAIQDSLPIRVDYSVPVKFAP